MSDDRPTWPTPEHAQRIVRELVALLGPYAVGVEGSCDVMSRVKRLLAVLNIAAPAIAVLARAQEVAPEIRAELLKAEAKLLGRE